MKNHLKRLHAPKRWDILRKTSTFIARPNPGAHKFEQGVPAVVLLRDMINVANNAKEVKYMVTKYEFKVDGRKRNDFRYNVGLMDVISMPLSKENYRVVLNKKGKLNAVKIDDKEAAIKPCKIIGKKMNGKKFQLSTHDGRNILVDKNDYNTGDTLVIEVPSQKIAEHLKLQPNMLAYLVGGKHAGSTGIIESIEGNKVFYKEESGKVLQTPKEYVFVLGTSKSIIKIIE